MTFPYEFSSGEDVVQTIRGFANKMDTQVKNANTKIAKRLLIEKSQALNNLADMFAKSNLMEWKP